jgi:hypothetical protein
MNTKTLSHAINEYIGGVSQFLQWFRVGQVWHAAPHAPCAAGSPAEADFFGKMKLIHDREMDAQKLVAKTGRRLAPLLVRAGHDATGVLKVVYFIAEGGGPDRRNLRSPWPSEVPLAHSGR